MVRSNIGRYSTKFEGMRIHVTFYQLSQMENMALNEGLIMFCKLSNIFWDYDKMISTKPQYSGFRGFPIYVGDYSSLPILSDVVSR